MNENDLKPGFAERGSGTLTSTNAAASGTANSTYSGDPDDLHDLFGSTENFSGTDEDDPLAALRNDPNYAALIRDLEYIASQARLLFAPAEETPSDDLWSKIQSKLSAEPTTEQ